MKFVSTRDLRINPAAVWKRLREQKDLVIMSNEKPVGVLTFADEDSLEDVLATLRQGRALSTTARIQQEATGKGFDRLPDNDIETIIQKTRTLRRKAIGKGKR